MSAPIPGDGLPAEVTIGGRGRDELQAGLRAAGVRLNAAAETLFRDPRFTTLATPRAVPVAACSLAALGCGDGATYDVVVAAACRLGLAECPLELGAHLRLAWTGQREGAAGAPAVSGRAPPGALVVASAPLDDDDATPKGFYLRRIDGVLWLRGYRASRDHVLAPDEVLVFARAIAGRASMARASSCAPAKES